ncbi:MAG: NUDIX hydrolase [Candidatus Levybacteria bacterium]|nr:NUDIX hydrolase [Candidatus Levybacteria bacterium]
MIDNQPKTMYVAVKGLFFENNKLLLVKKKYRDFWDSPGGRIEYGESIETALKRELREELLNVRDVSIHELVGVRKKEVPLEDGNELFLVYYHVQASLPEKIELSHEHTESKWFGMNEIKQLPQPLDHVYAELYRKLMSQSSGQCPTCAKAMYPKGAPTSTDVHPYC